MLLLLRNYKVSHYIGKLHMNFKISIYYPNTLKFWLEEVISQFILSRKIHAVRVVF